MALNAGVVGAHVVELARIYDVLAGWMRDVITTRTVTAFAPYVLLRRGLRVRVVVHRMAAITKRAGWALHAVCRIECSPPVGSVLDQVGQPFLVFDIPLCGEDEVIITNFGEVTLFPLASINKPMQ